MKKAMFIGGQEHGTQRLIEDRPHVLEFFEHPRYSERHGLLEPAVIQYRLVFITPVKGVLIYEVVL